MSSGVCCFGTATDCDNNPIYCLKDCVKTTYNHLRYLNANSKGIDLPESYLILCRAGVNVITAAHLGLERKICQFHRDFLGLYWKRSKRSCAHPFHGHSKSKPDRGITPVMSRELWLRLQLSVPIGEGIYFKNCFLAFTYFSKAPCIG